MGALSLEGNDGCALRTEDVDMAPLDCVCGVQSGRISMNYEAKVMIYQPIE